MHILRAVFHTYKNCNRFTDSKSDIQEASAIYSPLWMPWNILMTAQSAP